MGLIRAIKGEIFIVLVFVRVVVGVVSAAQLVAGDQRLMYIVKMDEMQYGIYSNKGNSGCDFHHEADSGKDAGRK